MNQLSALDLVKLARACPKVRQMLKKTAQDDTMFDENVPVVENAQGAQMGGQKPGLKMPQQAPFYMPQQEQYAAEPQDGYAPEADYGESPEQIGARAAQAFLGPDIWNAALQGDQNAQNIIGRTAGNVASSVAEMSANMMAGASNMGDQGYQPQYDENGMEIQANDQGVAPGGTPAPAQAPQTQQGAPQGMTTPEQDLADSLAPGAAPAAPNADVTPPAAGAKPMGSGKPTEGGKPAFGGKPTAAVNGKSGDFSMLKKVIAKIG